MDPLPWAKSVGPDYGKAQFKDGEPSASRPLSSQRPPEPLGTPMMPKARPADPPQANETHSGEAYYFNQLQRMDPEGRCSAMAMLLSDAEINDQPQEDLLVHMDKLRKCIELMEQAHNMQERTVERLKKDLNFMEDMSQEISISLIIFQGKYEYLILMKDAVLAEEDAQQAAEQADKETQKAHDAWQFGSLEEYLQKEGIIRDKAVYLLSPPAKKQKISEWWGWVAASCRWNITEWNLSVLFKFAFRSNLRSLNEEKKCAALKGCGGFFWMLIVGSIWLHSEFV